MRKTYTIPTITTAGDAVRETKGSTPSAVDVSANGNIGAPGSLGFNL
jgi:hypothetical protein